MYCRQCGYNNDQYSKLCHRCGSVMRDAEEHYDTGADLANESEQTGALKYVKKGEDIISKIKAPFRQLERVTENHRRRWPAIIITASVVLICLIVWLAVLGTKACQEVDEVIYGNTCANNVQCSLSAADEQFVYYSCPFGENPGLYRLSTSTGENLKISYHCLTDLSAVDGWIYGLDPTGVFIRVRSDGLVAQQVMEETHIKQPIVIGDYVYYISSNCCLYRAGLDTLTRRSMAKPQLLTNTMMSQFCIYNDVIYFLELTAEDYELTFTKHTLVTPEPIKDANGKKVQPDPYTVSELVPPTIASDIPVISGCIRQMTLDGENEAELLGTPVMRLTAGGGYLFFQTETTAVISATDIDPNAPPDMDYEFPSQKCWKLNLENLKYSTLLEANIADSPMLPTDDGWVYYITVDGNLERTGFSGGERFSILTYEQNVDRFSLSGGYMFVMTNGETCMIRMLPDGTEHVELCTAVPEVESEKQSEE